MPARAAVLIAIVLLFGCTKTKSAGFAGARAPIIRNVYFEGNRNVDDDDLLAGISSLPRDRNFLVFTTQYRYEASELELDVRRIEAHYRAHGYFSARATGAGCLARTTPSLPGATSRTAGAF